MAFRLLATTALLLPLLHGAAQAQTADRKTLTLEGARIVIAAAMAEARAKSAPGGVIAVVDDGGNLMALERLDGTFAAGANVSIGKARTAALFKKPTAFFEKVIRDGRTPMVALNDFTPLQGGVPIDVGGQIVGAVGVSGAASAQQDEELAIAGAKALTGGMGPAASPLPAPTGSTGNTARTASTASTTMPAASDGVAYFPGADVAAAVRKGAVLLERPGYMVHASHREEAGVGEVHTLDTDVIYVLRGAATLVTGGSLVDSKETAPYELRGTSILGGERQRISAGDVIVVPDNVPHWFEQVDGPIDYYVVKVRRQDGGAS